MRANMERYMQLFAAVVAISMLVIGPICFLLCFYVVLFTDYYLIALLYLAYLVYDRKTGERGGREIEWIRNWSFWEHAANYFPVTIIKTAELDPGKNYICGYHPHGIFLIGAMTRLVCGPKNLRKLFPGMSSNVIAASQLSWLPIQREIGFMLGCRTASKEAISRLLTKEGKGKMVILAIGGAVESLDAYPGTARLTLKNRKGFVKLAIKHGVSLVPMFAFGENDVIPQSNKPKPGTILKWIQDTFRRITGLALPLARSVIPRKNPIDIVVGTPIDVALNADPSEEEVDAAHKLYVDGLVALFDRYKVNYEAYKNVSIELI